MRQAIPDDLESIVTCIVSVSRFVQESGSGPHAERLPTRADSGIYEYAKQFVNDDTGFAIMQEDEQGLVGCLAGKIGPTSFAPSGIERVGSIEVCWVREDKRGAGIGSELVAEAESRFSAAGASIIELSYLAENAVAARAWNRMGFVPFRVTCYKQIQPD